MSMINPIQIVQGGQYGSEAKGAIAGELVIREKIDIAVRTGASNAGHTVYYRGEPFVMRQLPVGWVSPETQLVIGAGALIDPQVLLDEINNIQARTGIDLRPRLLVDYRAYLHLHKELERAREANRHLLIGSTGKGCSEAVISRLRLRGHENNTVLAKYKEVGLDDINITDTESYLNKSWDEGAKIQLEGTQGQLLDLFLGPYPYVTHKSASPSTWLSECGLSPALPTDIVMVIRTFPIRVAGNSGPLPLETDWWSLAEDINAKLEPAYLVEPSALAAFRRAVREMAFGYTLPSGSDGTDQHLWSSEDRVLHADALSNLYANALSGLGADTVAELRKLIELTTVTKKPRRIARLFLPDLARSARQIRPHRVAVTFMNYLFPSLWDMDIPITEEERGFITEVSHACKSPVFMINRGPNCCVEVDA